MYVKIWNITNLDPKCLWLDMHIGLDSNVFGAILPMCKMEALRIIDNGDWNVKHIIIWWKKVSMNVQSIWSNIIVRYYERRLNHVEHVEL
jgi:hypothetical protein